MTGTSNRVTITNGDGVSGNPTIDISAAYVGQATITTVGTVTTGTWSGLFGAVTGANLTNLTAANISAGTAGINISGNAATVTTNANLTGAITSSGNATSLGSFTSAQLATALTDETGSGANVFATSPTLVTPLLGTPTSGVLTNCTGLPMTTGVTGILGAANGGTGIANNAASTWTISGSFATTITVTGITGVTLPTTGTLATLAGAESLSNKTLVAPALGTPASGVMTNVTGTATGLTSGITNALKSATTTVDVSAATAPTNGQVLTATSGTTATWQAPASSGVFTLSFTSSDQTITSSGALTLAHGLGVEPKFVECVLVCQSTDNGYSAGNVINAALCISNNVERGYTDRRDATNITIRFSNSATVFQSVPAGGGSQAALDNTKWKLRVKAWA